MDKMPSREALRQKIASDPDLECEARPAESNAMLSEEEFKAAVALEGITRKFGVYIKELPEEDWAKFVSDAECVANTMLRVTALSADKHAFPEPPAIGDKLPWIIQEARYMIGNKARPDDYGELTVTPFQLACAVHCLSYIRSASVRGMSRDMLTAKIHNVYAQEGANKRTKISLACEAAMKILGEDVDGYIP